MFDVNFNLTRTEQFMQMLNEGGYVDELTSELKVSIPLLSLEFGKPTLVTIVFKPLPAGGWKMNYDVITMDFNLVYPDGYFGLTSGDKELRERDMIRCVIEVLFMVSFVYLMLEELAQLRQEIKERGHPFGYFVDFGNVLDLLNFIFQWLALYTYWQIYQQIQTIEMSPDLHYSIYADDFAVGRLTQVNRCDVHPSHTRHVTIACSTCADGYIHAVNPCSDSGRTQPLSSFRVMAEYQDFLEIIETIVQTEGELGRWRHSRRHRWPASVAGVANPTTSQLAGYYNNYVCISFLLMCLQVRGAASEAKRSEGNEAKGTEASFPPHPAP